MTVCNSRSELGILQNKEIMANFDGGLIGSDGGLMLPPKIAQQLARRPALAIWLRSRCPAAGILLVARSQ